MLKNEGLSSHKVDISSILKDSNQDEEVVKYLKNQLMTHDEQLSTAFVNENDIKIKYKEKRRPRPSVLAISRDGAGMEGSVQ
jgi:hypothetical protein